MVHWPTRTDFAFPEHGIADIELLLAQLPDLPRTIEFAKGLRPTFQLGPLLDAIAAQTGQPARALRRIFNALENMLDLQDEAGSADAAVDRLAAAVKPDLADKIKERRSELSHVLALYNRNNPISITLKAQRLTYLRERLFYEAEVITDVRPIFDADGETILQCVITHSLVLTVWSDGDFHRQHIAVDNADILKLREACDRAILKSRALKQELESKWTTEVLRDASIS